MSKDTRVSANTITSKDVNVTICNLLPTSVWYDVTMTSYRASDAAETRNRENMKLIMTGSTNCDFRNNLKKDIWFWFGLVVEPCGGIRDQCNLYNRYVFEARATMRKIIAVGM